MKITHSLEPRSRIGHRVNESDIRDGEIYDDGHPDLIWKRVGNSLWCKFKREYNGKWTENYNVYYFDTSAYMFTRNCRIIEDR